MDTSHVFYLAVLFYHAPCACFDVAEFKTGSESVQR